MNAHQQQHAIQGIKATVHVVAEKKVVMERGLASDFKKLK
jgi:hypothetical protein